MNAYSCARYFFSILYPSGVGLSRECGKSPPPALTVLLNLISIPSHSGMPRISSSEPLKHATQVEAHAHLLAAQAPRLVQDIARGLALRVLIREAVGKRRNIGVAAQERRDSVAPRGHHLPGVQLLHLGALGTTLAQVAVVPVLHARRAVVRGDEALHGVTSDQKDVGRSIQHPGRHRVHVHSVEWVVVCIRLGILELLSHDRLVLEQRVHDSPPNGVADVYKQDLMVPVGVIAAVLPVGVVLFVLMTHIVDSGVVYGLAHLQGASLPLGQIRLPGGLLRRQSHKNGALLLSRIHSVTAVCSLGAFSKRQRQGQPRQARHDHGACLATFSRLLPNAAGRKLADRPLLFFGCEKAAAKNQGTC
eukprot:scaffold102406_cov63-Phaeocystis_antarctica.AAC.1